MNEQMINIKFMDDTALSYLKQNIRRITEKILANSDNSWIYSEFKTPVFIEKKYQIKDFALIDNPGSKDKEKDFANSLAIYENLKHLPRYILCDERFWLWLYFEKFYSETKSFMSIKNEKTVLDHWTFERGGRRGIMFGVLSRMYFRVALTVDESLGDKYELSKWVIENPERFRNFSWRTYSSEAHIVRGALKGERRALQDSKGTESGEIYAAIAKYISQLGSVRLLDAISESDIEAFVYDKAMELFKNGAVER